MYSRDLCFADETSGDTSRVVQTRRVVQRERVVVTIQVVVMRRVVMMRYVLVTRLSVVENSVIVKIGSMTRRMVVHLREKKKRSGILDCDYIAMRDGEDLKNS